MILPADGNFANNNFIMKDVVLEKSLSLYSSTIKPIYNDYFLVCKQ